MKYTTIIAALTMVGCPNMYEPKPAPIPKDTNWCEKAEGALEQLQCKDRAGDPMWVNKNGERFKTTCEIAQREGRIFLNPRCVAEAKSCTDANKCPADGME